MPFNVEREVFMSNVTNRHSDILENEYVVGISHLIRSAFIAVAAIIFFWVASLLKRFSPATPQVNNGFFYFAILLLIAGICLALYGVYRMYSAKKTDTVNVDCPYCDHTMRFMTEPTTDFDCENCHRKVVYENGIMVPVKIVTCTFCHTEHRVSEKATTYTCDSCNRGLRLSSNTQDTEIQAEASELLQNYDVVLTQIGRNKDQVAMALESIMICNLREARRQMEDLPLIVAHDLPERKAEALRRRLREMGATAVMRPAAAGTVASDRP